MFPKGLCFEPVVRALITVICTDPGEHNHLLASVRPENWSFISLYKEIEHMKSKAVNLFGSSGITNSNLTSSFNFVYNFLCFF